MHIYRVGEMNSKTSEAHPASFPSGSAALFLSAFSCARASSIVFFAAGIS